ncbi:MAG: M1 family aminopeptidase [Bacteroidota bacterium]
MVRSKHGLKVIFWCLSFIACSHISDFPVAGISQDLARARKSQIDSVCYNVSFDIPADKQKPIDGILNLAVKLNDTSKDLVLDFEGADSLVSTVKSSAGEVAFEVLNGHLILPKKYLTEQNKFEIQFVAGNKALNRKDDYLYTLFVPANASSCFPVFDQPNIKGKYVLTLTIPEHWTALSNESPIETSKVGIKKRIVFDETPPISSYLFAFTAGVFETVSKTIGSRRYTMLHREPDSVKVNKNLDKIFDWHHKSLVWLEEYTGINYPFNKFGFALLPSFQFGGMEHPGAIFYKASSLILDDSRTIAQEKGRARLIAHETAHMWFGDLVTMDWFNDVWLKEVFANFMAAKITQPGFPDINHDLQFLLSYYPGAYAVDRTKGSHPIQQPLENLKDAGSLYGNIIYQKSPIIMRMLEENMGEDAFRKGIQQYLEQYAFDNAKWDDLVAIMGQQTDYNLSVWNEQWVKSAKMPSIHYNIRSKNDSISKYNIYTVSRDGDAPIWWPQKLQIEIGWSDSSKLFEVNKDFRVANLNELKGLPFPEYVFNNAGGLGYGYFDMKSGSLNYFLENTGNQTDPVKRAALWINLNEAAVRGRIDPDKLVAAQIENLAVEKEPLVIAYLLRSLQHLYWIYLDSELRIKHVAKLESVLLNHLVNADASVKALYLDVLKRIATSEKAVALLESLLMGKVQIESLSLSDRDKASLAFELAVRDYPNAEELLLAHLSSIENEDLRNRLHFVKQAVSGSNNDRQVFFESLKNVDNRSNEEWVLEALKYLHHPLRVEESQKLIPSSLELLEEVKSTGDIFFPKRWLDRTLENHQSEEALDAVMQFLYKENNYPKDLKNKVLQSSDHLFRSVEVRENWKERRQNEKVELSD